MEIETSNEGTSQEQTLCFYSIEMADSFKGEYLSSNRTQTGQSLNPFPFYVGSIKNHEDERTTVIQAPLPRHFADGPTSHRSFWLACAYIK